MNNMSLRIELIIFILLLLLPSCTLKQVTTTPERMIVNEWNELPIIPDGIKYQEDSTSYSYTTSKSIIDAKDFYKEQMKSMGWDFLDEGDISTNKIDEAFIYWYSKDEVTATVEIFIYNGVVHISLSLS